MYFDNFKFYNFVLEIDSNKITQYGFQDSVKKDIIQTKKRKPIHHPFIAFIAHIKMVANWWLLRSDTSLANNFIGSLEAALSKLKIKKVSLLRQDSGFVQSAILNYIDSK